VTLHAPARGPSFLGQCVRPCRGPSVRYRPKWLTMGAGASAIAVLRTFVRSPPRFRAHQAHVASRSPAVDGRRDAALPMRPTGFAGAVSEWDLNRGTDALQPSDERSNGHARARREDR
jgi:hypothetical protein